MPATAFFSLLLASQQLAWLALTLAAWGLEVTCYQPCSNLWEFQQQMNPNVLVLLLIGVSASEEGFSHVFATTLYYSHPASSSFLSGAFFFSAQLLLGNVNESWQAGTFN